MISALMVKMGFSQLLVSAQQVDDWAMSSSKILTSSTDIGADAGEVGYYELFGVTGIHGVVPLRFCL